MRLSVGKSRARSAASRARPVSLHPCRRISAIGIVPAQWITLAKAETTRNHEDHNDRADQPENVIHRPPTPPPGSVAFANIRCRSHARKVPENRPTAVTATSWRPSIQARRCSARQHCKAAAMSDRPNDPVEAARLAYAEELRFIAHIRSAALHAAFAAVPRERFVGAGPWRIRSPIDLIGRPRMPTRVRSTTTC